MANLDLETMPEGTFAYSRKHNVVCYKLPKGAELQGQPHVIGDYPNPEPYTAIIQYCTKPY